MLTAHNIYRVACDEVYQDAASVDIGWSSLHAYGDLKGRDQHRSLTAVGGLETRR